MALDVDATPGGTDANSFADPDDAKDYASYRSPAWLALTADQQARSLVSASIEIGALEPYATDTRSTTTQALAWPRGGDTALPMNLVRATYELAISYTDAITNGTDPLAPDNPAARGIKREKVDTIETEYFGPTVAPDGVIYYGPNLTSVGDPSPLSRFPRLVQLLLAPLLDLGSSVITPNTWGTGEVRRGS